MHEQADPHHVVNTDTQAPRSPRLRWSVIALVLSSVPIAMTLIGLSARSTIARSSPHFTP